MEGEDLQMENAETVFPLSTYQHPVTNMVIRCMTPSQIIDLSFTSPLAVQQIRNARITPKRMVIVFTETKTFIIVIFDKGNHTMEFTWFLDTDRYDSCNVTSRHEPSNFSLQTIQDLASICETRGTYNACDISLNNLGHAAQLILDHYYHIFLRPVETIVNISAKKVAFIPSILYHPLLRRVDHISFEDDWTNASEFDNVLRAITVTKWISFNGSIPFNGSLKKISSANIMVSGCASFPWNSPRVATFDATFIRLVVNRKSDVFRSIVKQWKEGTAFERLELLTCERNSNDVGIEDLVEELGAVACDRKKQERIYCFLDPHGEIHKFFDFRNSFDIRRTDGTLGTFVVAQNEAIFCTGDRSKFLEPATVETLEVKRSELIEAQKKADKMMYEAENGLQKLRIQEVEYNKQLRDAEYDLTRNGEKLWVINECLRIIRN